MLKPRVKLERSLYDRVREFAYKEGYASPDEFVAHVLEQALLRDETGGDEETVRKRLQGLGYLG